MDLSFLTHDCTPVEGHVELTTKTLQAFQKVYQIANPAKMAEIGFNAGHSAYMALELMPEVIFHSVDACRYEYTRRNAIRMYERYGDRFRFTAAYSNTLPPKKLAGNDLIFVDGRHEREYLHQDLWLCRDANVKYILVDDYDTTRDWLLESVVELVDEIVNTAEFPYTPVCVIDYDCSDGENRAILLKRTEC
jgi:hypothetical protein